MALETKLVQKLSQSLLMTPQLQQAIKLLQLGRLEYIEAIQNELLENPILEEMKDEEFGDSEKRNTDPKERSKNEQSKEIADSNENPVEWEDYLANFSDYRGSSSPKGLVDFEDRPSYEATLTKSEDLYDHIASQLRMSELSHADQEIAMHVVGNLNKDGYLCCSYDEIAESCKCTLGDLESVMEVIHSLDPIGLGARDLKECLLLQLDAMGLLNSLETRIVRDHLDKLERRKYEQIAKAEKVELEQIYQAVMTIQSLDPRPGLPYSDDETRYIVPDIYVYKDGEDYVITLNEDGLPRLRVSPYYLDLLKNGGNDPSKSYLNERLKAASWLIKSIHQRQQTIYKVTESIVKFQREFLDGGIAFLKPLVLKDVADDIGMHESTVSRVTTNKYVHTPQGVFELKFFFTTGLKAGGQEVSSSAVKERIKNIIGAEPPDNPISDQKIVELLGEESVKIARRTVAKYRESLGILSSSKRKKVF